MKNAFLNNNDMSQYDQDIINQALGFLKEDNKRFVKIVTAKKNVVAAESDIKIISDNKFYPVQYWLDTVTDPKQLEVLKELGYLSELYLIWWDTKFDLFINRRPEMSEIFNRSDVRLGGKSLREFGKELVDKTDREPFYDPNQHAAVDQVMNQLLDKIYLDIDRSSSVPLYPSTIPPISSELAPPVADVTTMEPVKEIDGFVKGKETLVNSCTQKMQSLKPSDKIIFYGSEKFDFTSWWTSLPKRYSGTEVIKILRTAVMLYAPPNDLEEGEEVPEDRPLYVEAAEGKITNPGKKSDETETPTTPPATPTTPAAPATEISASFLISKFIKIAQEPEKSFDEIFDGVLDDYLKSTFGEPPEDDGKDVVEEESEKAPKKKTNIFESLKERLQRKPEENVAKATNTMLFYDFAFDSILQENPYYDPEKKRCYCKW